MENSPHTWDQIPNYLFELGRKVDNLTALVNAKNASQQPAPDQRFTLEELCDYLPGKLAPATIYGYVQRGEIPFSRMGKRLTFLKSEIDSWLNSRKGKTFDEIKADALARTAQPTKSGRKSVVTQATKPQRNRKAGSSIA